MRCALVVASNTVSKTASKTAPKVWPDPHKNRYHKKRKDKGLMACANREHCAAEDHSSRSCVVPAS